MITCSECGRINGKGQFGTSWICRDCKVGEKKAESDAERQPQERAKEDSLKSSNSN